MKLSEALRVDLKDHLYDCLSFYKHGDQSHDWRACRIVRRERKESVKNDLNLPVEVPLQQFIFWIEFEHLKNEGPHMWTKREASEILFSKEYTRNYTCKFESDAIQYLNHMYNSVNTQKKGV
jgi:hypothetical protein